MQGYFECIWVVLKEEAKEEIGLTQQRNDFHLSTRQGPLEKYW
jgi:hypothetical protein